MTTIIIRALSHQFGVSYSKLSSLICWTEKGMLDLEGHPMRQNPNLTSFNAGQVLLPVTDPYILWIGFSKPNPGQIGVGFAGQVRSGFSTIENHHVPIFEQSGKKQDG